MGAESHSQGHPYRVADRGRGDLREVLGAHRRRSASVRWVVYVRPLGRGQHEVKNLCNESVYTVGSAAGSKTFRAGSIVGLASNAGTPGEVIIGSAEAAGASSFAPVLTRRNLTFPGPPDPEPEPPACPVLVSGKSYLGISLNIGAKTLSGWNYTDGTYTGLAGPVTSYAGLSSIPSRVEMTRIHSAGDVVVFRGRLAGGEHAVCTWDVAAGTLDILATGLYDTSGPVWPGSGDYVYFQETVNYFGPDRAELTLYRSQVGQSGVLNLVTAQVGPTFVDLTNSLSAPLAICGTAVDVQIPAFWAGVPAVPWAPLAGGWTDGTDRALLSAVSNNVETNGFPVTGNRSARVTYFDDSFNYTIGLLPAGPSSPEVALIPDEWAVLYIGQASPVPGGAELVSYPFELAGDGGSSYMFRCPAGSVTIGAECAIPRTEVGAGPDGLPVYMLPKT